MKLNEFIMKKQVVVLGKNQKIRITINIMGEDYVIKGGAPQSHLQSVSEYVDYLMRSLAQNNPQMSKQNLAVLCSINLADEVLKLKDELDRKGYLHQLQLEQESNLSLDENQENRGEEN